MTMNEDAIFLSPMVEIYDDADVQDYVERKEIRHINEGLGSKTPVLDFLDYR